MASQSTKVVPGTTYSAVIGQILVHLREEAGKHQAELAKDVGMQQSTWSRVENGQSSLSVEQLDLAASALGTSSDAIVRQADVARDKLTKHGVNVVHRKQTSGSDVVIALVVGAALGALMLALLSKKK